MVPVVPAIVPELEAPESPDAAPVDVPHVVDVAVGEEPLDGGVLEDTEPDLDRLEREKVTINSYVINMRHLRIMY